MSYGDPIYQTIVALANAAVSTVADIAQIASPVPGKTGRIVGVSMVAKVAIVGSLGNLLVGTVADPDAYATIPVVATALDTPVPLTDAVRNAFLSLPADSTILISGDGLATSGTLDVAITIAWF